MINNRVGLERAIGYPFNDLKLLEEALTHSSFSNEKKGKNPRNNERLEFLGDSVLSVVISEYLFSNYPDLPEGELTKIRAKVVCEMTLGECSKKISLGTYMNLGRGEEMTGGRERVSILADAFEALIAAIYLDGGLEPARAFVINQMENVIVHAVGGKVIHDYKTFLQELVQTKKENRIIYELFGEEGPDHCKTFHIQVKLNDRIIGNGTGRSKKEAEQEAAKVAIGMMNGQGTVGL